MPDRPVAHPSSASRGGADLPLDGALRMERVASDLYHVASLLLGESEEAIGLVEKAIGEAESSATETGETVRALRLQLGGDAVAQLAASDAEAFLAPEPGDSGPVSCIEGDELDAAGVTSAELEAMLTGPDNAHLRAWIESLPVALRTIFVLRAVAGFSSAEIAVILADSGGPAAENWTPEGVRTTYRQALCSLAAQLLHATAER